MSGSILLLNWLGKRQQFPICVKCLSLWSKANMPVLTWVAQFNRVSNICLAVV